MYDYISIRSDSNYSEKIGIDKFIKLMKSILEIKQISKAGFEIEIGEFKYTIQGIKADNRGCYSFNNDSKFNSINLVEFIIPLGGEVYEKEIIEIAKKISTPLSWQIIDHNNNLL